MSPSFPKGRLKILEIRPSSRKTMKWITGMFMWKRRWRKGSLIKKNLEVRTWRFSESLDNGVRGRVFIQTSMDHNTIINSSKVMRLPRKILKRCLLANLIEDSHNPPKLWTYGDVKFRVMNKVAEYIWIWRVIWWKFLQLLFTWNLKSRCWNKGKNNYHLKTLP